MGKDRTSIIEIISEMLENTDPCGIYNTSAAFDKLESLVTEARGEAVGWMYAEACIALDNGKDIRKIEVPIILEKAKRDLELNT